MTRRERHDPGMDPRDVRQSNFLNNALNETPKAVLAFIGTAVGTSIAIVFILVIGGMQGPATRIANAYAQRIEASAMTIQEATKALNEQVVVLKDVISRLQNLEDKANDTLKTVVDHEARITRLELSRRKRLTD